MDLEILKNSGFANIALIEELYEQYKNDPGSVDPSWIKEFQACDHKIITTKGLHPIGSVAGHESLSDLLRVQNLIDAYRTYGHLMASTNPLHVNAEKLPWQLNLMNFHLSESDLQKNFPTCGLLPYPEASLDEIIKILKNIYCETVGLEYMWTNQPELQKWLQEKIEPNGFKTRLTIDQKKMILQHLNKSELFELFLHTKYTGQKRFSLEGAETLIPVLASVVDKGAECEVEEFIIGMAHRGRLNVLSNILNKPYAKIFSEFDENSIPESFEQSGDVKYHKGFFSENLTSHGHKVQITLTPNPSHLEAVDPIVEGQAYVKQEMLTNSNSKQKVLPILIHGDAALAGQGVVYETMQMYALEGYGTGGTVHIVINNQIGFTTIPRDSRSTFYCTDIAHTFGSPVFHVNAEDPESCIFATNLAVEIRQKFQCDVFIDLICYRKYGHNETDEPAFTQPHEYQIINKKKSIRELYRDELIRQGILEKKISEDLEKEFKNSLQEELKGITTKPKVEGPIKSSPPVQIPTNFPHLQTGVSLGILKEIAAAACRIPDDFTAHPKLAKLQKDRLQMLTESEGTKPVDWGMAEMLAFGSLLWEGVPIRLSGQDCCRGTFSHRHAMWMDQKEERPYFPLKHLKEGQGKFEVYNSLLSEYAVLGFEFGYNIANPNSLVIWEAQFGDFGNGAQVMIDQFISTGEQKWGQQISLVLLLPHGYEGQGPEHSSGRIERFMTLSGQDNLQIVNPSTPAQFFHLLRRQMKSPVKKPLIVFTPKALLRHPACISSIKEFTLGSFQEILDDLNPPATVKKLLLCSGHVYYDLIAAIAKEKDNDIAVIRVEQLYPFDLAKMKEIIRKYNKIDSVYWVQEEPRNMGAGEFMKPILLDLMPKDVEFRYIARPRSASPAVGSHAAHKKQLEDLISAALGQKQPSIFEIASQIKTKSDG